MSQRLRVILPGHARRLHVHAAQQCPVGWQHAQGEELLRGAFLLPLFGSSVLKPHLRAEEHDNDYY